jgi:1-deoxy-D-xylulose-5-phosphate synthase
VVTPHTFFEALGIRYGGPIDGHDIAGVEQALANASEWPGPIVVHVVTQKGRGYAPAEEDEIQRLHDVKVSMGPVGDAGAEDGKASRPAPAPDESSKESVGAGLEGVAQLPVTTFTDAFTRSLVHQAEADPRIVAITAAMPGPTGLLPFQARFPERFVDVGIAEQHAVTSAAGMAMAGLRPVVAVYSTFFSRAFDQANLDVGLHRLPVVLVLDRAGITGDDGPSHHGVLDMALALSIPGMTVFAPSSAPEVEVMLAEALTLDGPSLIRFPKTPAPWVEPGTVGSGLQARRTRTGDGSVCILAVGKMVTAANEAALLLADDGIEATVWDVRVVSEPDPAMVADAVRHDAVLTAEDGIRQGGAGMFLADAIRASCPGGAAPPVTSLGIPRAYIAQGKADDILSQLGLDGPGLALSVRSALSSVREAVSVRTPKRGGASPAGPAPSQPTATLPASITAEETLD